MLELEGKSVFVAGGSGLLGSAISRRFSECGAEVGIGYAHDQPAAEKLSADLRHTGEQAVAIHVDVRSSESIKRALDYFCAPRGGSLDIVVNCAGINRPVDFDETSDSDWDEVVDVNLGGAFKLAKYALPYLASGVSPSIVHIGSASAQIGGPRTAHYAASKSGLSGLSRVAARFGAASAIRSNVVAPGYIESDMADGAMVSPQVAAVVSQIPLGRLARADEVAWTVAFVASPLSSYTTGQTINVNGGLYLT